MSESRTAPGDSSVLESHAVSSAVVWVHPELRFDSLAEGVTLIGRADDATIRLSGSQVSRRHATISRRVDVLQLRDEGSLNKPRVNGVPVSEARVRDNDVVRVGEWVGVILQSQQALDTLATPFVRLSGMQWGPRTQLALATLPEASRSQLPIVLQGDTGTGKELVARWLHAESGRSGPLVAVNCAAQPDNLFEAQFFGYAKGAFTGATSASPGYFAAAHGGTLFLDELPELSLAQQAKLLRAVEEQQVMPVGSTATRRVDVRIVSATQWPLGELVEQGAFRPDLRARLSGITLRLPPLSERREEILPLFGSALQAERRIPRAVSAGFAERLSLYSWPLNAREVVAVARRCNALWMEGERLNSACASKLLGQPSDSRSDAPVRVAVRPRPHDVRPTQPRADEEAAIGRRRALWFERHRGQFETLQGELANARGNVSEAARRAGISRQRALRLLEVDALLRQKPLTK